MKYGIQLYSVKDFMVKDVKETITEIGKMGYKVVEPAAERQLIEAKECIDFLKALENI